MTKDTKLIIEQCLSEKIEEYRSIVKSDLGNIPLKQLERFNQNISELRMALEEVKGEKTT